MSGWMGVGTVLARFLFPVWSILNSILSSSQSYNSEGQNPCEIAGSLQAPCLGYCASPIGFPPNEIDCSRDTKQPPTCLDRSVMVPTTLLPRKTTLWQRPVAATPSSIACTPLAPLVSSTLPTPRSRKHSLKCPLECLYQLSLDVVSKNSWKFWEQFCDNVSLTRVS